MLTSSAEPICQARATKRRESLTMKEIAAYEAETRRSELMDVPLRQAIDHGCD